MAKSPLKRDSIKEQELLELVKKVKYHNDEAAYKKLHFYMKPYIDIFCNKFVIAGLGNDDIEQECSIALKYKAIDDFNPSRGKFKTFAVLCIKRHLFSKIKENNQNKKKAINVAVSIDESHEENGEELMLRNLLASGGMSADERLGEDEEKQIKENLLISKLSDLEKDVYILYVQKYHYEEMVEILRREGREDISLKCIDNSVQRLKMKARNMSKSIDF